MEVVLNKKPKSPLLIQGFPGFGLVGNITTEFLINHLHAELIGSVTMEEIVPIIAIHDGKVVQPIGIFYDKKNNLVIIHVIANLSGHEWKIKQAVEQIAQELDAKEIINLEGVGSAVPSKDTNVFYFTNKKENIEKFKKIKISALDEGIVVGVTGALLLETKFPTTCLFAEVHSKLPDSKAAAKVIEVLDKYLDLDVDYKPLLEEAKKLEEKLKMIMEQSQDTVDKQEQKKLSYLG